MPHDDFIKVWLSSEQKADLKRLAAEDERPVSVFVRLLIERAIDENVVPREARCKGRCGTGEGR